MTNDTQELSPPSTTLDLSFAQAQSLIDQLDDGSCRTANPENGQWVTNIQAKRAILTYMKHQNCRFFDSHPTAFDKIDLKFANWTEADFRDRNIRQVPGAIVRTGSFIGNNVVLMPCFVNIGAYVDNGTMLDTFSSIGSGAQIGKNCHISGGAGIGGVLEPEQACPTIIEDNCFIGARSEVAEGVIVREGSVLAMGVFLSQSTKIFNRATGEITYGEIPPYSVVVPGNLPSADRSHSLSCAIIVKQVDAKTKAKTSINELLR